MKRLSSTLSLSLGALLGSAALLSGCSDMGGSFPDSVVSTQVQGPPMDGSVFGGHAPVVGAHVYLLQPGTTGIGSAATSLLGSVIVGGITIPVLSANGYTITSDTSDPNVPVGSKYVTTDSNGGFSLTGAYTCTANQPVYIYAYGGNIGSTTTTTVTNYTISQIVVGNPRVGSGAAQTATYTFTVSPAEAFTAGQTVTISGLTGRFSVLNNTQTVLAAGLSTTTFEFTATDSYIGSGGSQANIANGTYTQSSTPNYGTTGLVTITVTTTNPATQNNAIVQLATLGNCPGSGNLNFGSSSSDPINFVYMNEVSTVATAYTFQPFTLATKNSAWDIGSSGSTQGLLGIENAANTAAQLYNIQGHGQTSTSGDGEGHVANFETESNNGNGVVPEATIDTLADILAACVDSVPAGGGGPSASCVTLFANATDNGLTTGTNPTDSATAAINIARYPAGNHSSASGVNASFVSNLFLLPTGAVPYVPALSNAPNDFTIAINYPYTQVTPAYGNATNNTLQKAESIAVDQTGEVWITAQTDWAILRWSPLGHQDSYYSSAENPTGPNSYIYGYVSIDGSNNAWAGNANGTTSIQEFNSNGVQTNTYGSGYTTAYTVVADQTGNAYFFASNAGTAGAPYNTQGNSNMWKYNSGGTLMSSSATCNGVAGSYVYNCVDPTIFNAGAFVAHGAIESASAGGHLWLTSENTPWQISRVSPTGVKDFVYTDGTGVQQPEFPSIDKNGNAWIAAQETASVIYKITPTATTPFYTVTKLTSAGTGAELTSTFGSAVDGNNNIWFTNRSGNYGSVSGVAGTNTIVVINGSNNLAISPPTNYKPEAQYPATANTFTTMLNDSLNLAIDPSGNVWITNYLGGAVVEMVGAAAPVVTPLSVAAGTNKLGVTP